MNVVILPMKSLKLIKQIVRDLQINKFTHFYNLTRTQTIPALTHIKSENEFEP